MDIIKAIVLGIVQGVTEWLPISSSAHLRVVPELLGWADPGTAATAVMQLGTTAAVLVYFRRDIIGTVVSMLKALRSPQERKTPEAQVGFAVILGTIPIMVGALLLKHQIETRFRDLRIIAIAFIVMGIALYAAEMLSKKNRPLDTIKAPDGIITGLAQALALIPGASRSGSTLIGAYLSGLNKAAAVRFSFLLSIPATLIAGLYELKDVIKPEASKPGDPVTMTWTTPSLAVATFVAFVVGYATIAWLLKYLSRHSTLVFVVYRVLLGILLLVLVSQGTLQANHP